MNRARAELWVAGLLLLAALAAVGFIVAYLTGGDTQWLGVCLGVAFAALAAAAILASNHLVAAGRAEEERPAFTRPTAEGREAITVRAELAAPLEGISRRRLIGGAAGAAGLALGAALALPAASLGPKVGANLTAGPWRRGLRLVDENDLPVRAEAIAERSFLTAFPEGADKDALAAPVVVVRTDPTQLALPAGREDWAPQGLLAYSKICTHAGCAVNLYRSPLYEPLSPRPALVCPCHYSTFDVRRGAEVIFGPAGRPLPQLPLAIDREGILVAGGGLSGRVGPAWSGVREG